MSDTRRKILIVGAGHSMGPALARAIAESIETAASIVEVAQPQDTIDLSLCAEPDKNDAAWYRKFSGKRGKAPRY